MEIDIKNERRETIEQMHKDNILTAAEELFFSKGFDKTTVDDISHKASYSKRTVYICFKSKEEIYNNIILKGINLLKKFIVESLKSHTDFITRYYSMCKALDDFYDETPEYFTGIVNFTAKEIPADASQIASTINAVHEEIIALIEHFFEEGQTENIILKNIDLKKTILIFWNNLIGLMTFSNTKTSYIKDKTKATRTEFLSFGYNLLLNSVLDGGTYE